MTSLNTDVEYERITRILNSLVKHFLREPTSKTSGKDVKATDLTLRQQQTFDFCIRILGSRITPSIASDEIHVSDLIKKKLIREHKSSSKALRFTNLFTKLQSQSIVTRKWAILYFLLSVSEQSNIGEIAGSVNNPIERAFAHRGLQDLSKSQEFERIKPTSEELKFERIKPTSEELKNRFIQNTLPIPTLSSKSSKEKESLPPKTILTKQLAILENNNEISEILLLRDIVFIFQGIDGQYIKYDKNSSYIIDPKAEISRSTRGILHRLSELGRLFRHVNDFVCTNVNDTSIGLVGQAFCYALQRELTEYYKFIAVLEAQVTKVTDSQQVEHNGLSLKRVLAWTQESLLNLRMMSELVDCCKQKRGGALVSTIYNYTNHGDPFIQQFINNMLEEVSRPFFEMLQRWVYGGELEDPFEEFFVACDPNVEEEDLWQSKYTIRPDMQPTFISPLLAKKIFAIGKSLNFIRYSCHDNDWVITNAGADKVLKYGDIIALECSIDATYTVTSQRLLNILFTKYKLKEHFTALKRYLLLGQGDFIQHLMAQLGPGLSKPANTLYRHNLTGTLESAIRASNAQYDDPDILRRLDVRLLEVSFGEAGWDVFSLDYHVDSPINTIFTPHAMQQYLKLFNFLWRLKRVEHDLSSAWRRNMTNARSLYQIEELKKDINTSRLVCSEMIHFTSQLQYYILFEVIECSWDELVKDYTKSGDLDSLIEAHNKYLKNITTKVFLDTSSNQSYHTRLLNIIQFIFQYKNGLDELHNFSLKEILRGDNANIERGQHKMIQERLTETAGLFKREVVGLLVALANHHDTDLRFLSVRLDFNEFYRKGLINL
ncbi:Gamma-tubulin complex component 3 [Gigaspora margarita]|uniref:Gamma-tubulin complex component 3 n=1 Tax=Gigaspora margarita TaxID=4874 RepID=A0A8H3ZZR6_GIGMA|nr:Gamma-tubulin complex component 3 [Gigaspora margarita]